MHHTLMYVQKVLVNSSERLGFIDWGSELTLIRENDAKNIFGSLDVSDSKLVTGFGGAVFNSIGSYVGSITIQNVTANVPCIVVPVLFF